MATVASRSSDARQERAKASGAACRQEAGYVPLCRGDYQGGIRIGQHVRMLASASARRFQHADQKLGKNISRSIPSRVWYVSKPGPVWLHAQATYSGFDGAGEGIKICAQGADDLHARKSGLYAHAGTSVRNQGAILAVRVMAGKPIPPVCVEFQGDRGYPTPASG
jgi:hypothetical protein